MLSRKLTHFRLLVLSFLVVVLWRQYSGADLLAKDKLGRPGVGDTAADFELLSPDGKKMRLSKLTAAGPVVVIVLRGYPGYQCPVCSTQLGQFLSRAKSFEKAGAQVVMVYPGPAEGLKQHAEDFVSGKTLPAGFHLVFDPDYDFTKAWKLRWDAPGETAYPATFVVDSKGTIQFAKISMTHGGRAGVDEVLKVLAK
jgi:thioredoxin-dependent peroxiredoxin